MNIGRLPLRTLRYRRRDKSHEDYSRTLTFICHLLRSDYFPFGLGGGFLGDGFFVVTAINPELYPASLFSALLPLPSLSNTLASPPVLGVMPPIT
jgi:hypothetical protein